MSKRLGFKPSFIRSQPNYQLRADGINTGTFGTFANYSGHSRREGFDLVNKTFSNKVYVCVDKATKKYAISFDANDKSYTAPAIIKPVDLHDKSQWITSDAGAGVLNFFYSLKNYIHIELKENKQLGIVPIMRSDLWENAFFKFGDDNEIIVDFNKGGKSSDEFQYCLAFKKTGLPYDNESVDSLAVKWNQEYKYFDASTISKYDPNGTKVGGDEPKKEGESFIARAFNYLWKPIRESFFVKEAMGEDEEPADSADGPDTTDIVTDTSKADPTKPAPKNDSGYTYLELVKLQGINKELYSYQWIFQEVWDIRTATNIALETKQIEDLQAIDQEALTNKEKAYQTLKDKYTQEKAQWEQEKADYDAHFMTKFY